MQLSTKHFGPIEIDKNGIINMREGLPGFEAMERFILLGTEDDGSPFRWLQSVDDAGLTFAVVDPFRVKSDYDINISDECVRKLEIEKLEDILVYCIVVVPEEITKMTMNLKAPVIINTKNNRGAQVVLDTDRYSVRHYILEELHKQEVRADASADKEERPVNNSK